MKHLFTQTAKLTFGLATVLFLAFSGAIHKAGAQTVSTLAGLAVTSGSDDGTGSAARFNTPIGVAADVSGNVFVADNSNHTIRKITPAGVVSTFAGLAGTSGSDDGTGTAARFSGPYGVAVDASGNVYVGDHLNHTIRKITPAGVVSTFAGLAGTSGSDDGTGAAARFFYPAGTAVDASGNVFVADKETHIIRKITPAGVVSTLAGSAGTFGSADGIGAAASFYYPTGVAVDASGNVFVADQNNQTIRKITPAGVVSTFAGLANTPGSDDGTGAAARFSGPIGLAVDASGNVFVADAFNHLIRKITPAGVVSTLAGSAGTIGSADGIGAAASFNVPVCVAVDASGNVYVADQNNQTIRKITATATPALTTTGTLTAFAACAGSASAAQSFSVSGSDLTDNLTVTAPAGFEVSTASGSGFGASLTLTPSSGSVAGTTIYVRLAATAMGTPSGNVTCSSPGAADKTVAASGTAKPVPSSALTASQTEVCPNTQVTLDAHCSIVGASVTWNPGAPTVIPDAATTSYIYKASCTEDGCSGNESSVEIRTHRILVDLKEVATGTLPQPIFQAVKDNMGPTNTITAATNARRWTMIATGCAASESVVFKLSGPVSFNSIDNGSPYALFANVGAEYFAIDHPNYGNGGSFPNGTYNLTVELRSADGAGGPFPKNRVATGTLLATRSLQFTVATAALRQGEMASENRERITESGFFAQVAPNPVSNRLQLKVQDSKGQSVEVRLTDVSGRTLLQRGFLPETDAHSEEFDVSEIIAGMYFLKVNAGQKQTTLKVIKVQ